ncbi:MAG: DNA polymerase III subunit gamma/tau [Bacilli bacterium]|nr:DNA polymerase III subunit gamma/tau [Bacilli bacterium]
MDYKVLYRKYRPTNFSELVGQDNIKDLLISSIINNKLSHAYIFTGPRGTGKTSAAKIFAKTVNCEKLIDNNPCNKCSFCLSYEETSDVIEIDAASNNGVEEIREIRENVKILPNSAKYKIYIIDEVHMLSNSAWNAFLKTLEEPPKHVIFILATTEIQKIPITVLSRCQRFDFQKINADVISKTLEIIASKEKINITKDSLDEIALMSDGGLRDALSILDQLSKIDKKITLITLKNTYGIITKSEIKELFDNYFKNNYQMVLDNIENFDSLGVKDITLINKMLDYLLDLLMKEKTNDNKVQYLEKLIKELESCYNKSNKFLMIKAVLISNIRKQDIAPEILEQQEVKLEVLEKKVEKQKEIISREIILNQNEDVLDKIKEIRINNSFVNADINLKKQFNKTWELLLELLFKNNELKLEGLLKESKVEVVSPTNILLSTKSYSNSVLLNSMSEQISKFLKSEFELLVKIVCLDESNWNEVKKEYIKTKKEKKYELIEEPKVVIDEKVVNSAEVLFGNQLIEIK